MKTIFAHKCILGQRSQVFNDRFRNEWKGDQILIESTSFVTFSAFLFYFYSGKIDMASLNLSQVMELYDLAEQFIEPYVKWRAENDICSRLIRITSLQELFDAYERSKSHPNLHKRLVDRILGIISMDNCLQISHIAFEKNDEQLLNRAARFMRENGSTLWSHLNLKLYDLDFADALLKAILKSIMPATTANN